MNSNPNVFNNARSPGFNAFAAGDKKYGSGRPMPNIGPSDPLGYRERNLQIEARKNAIGRRLKALRTGDIAKAHLGPGSAPGGGTVGI